MKHLAIAATAVVALLFPSTAMAGGWETTVEKVPGDWTMSSTQCPNLPAGTTLTGTGTGTSITKVRTDSSGTTSVYNLTVTPGRATDQAGNEYHFLYRNSFLVSKAPSDALFTGEMVDVFKLQGGGPARLRNGFVANLETNLDDVFILDPISQFGDPLDFETGAAMCDPL
jgi:hypothetical protein